MSFFFEERERVHLLVLGVTIFPRCFLIRLFARALYVVYTGREQGLDEYCVLLIKMLRVLLDAAASERARTNAVHGCMQPNRGMGACALLFNDRMYGIRLVWCTGEAAAGKKIG